jgi:F-type H+-transporting ATPase subunit delta
MASSTRQSRIASEQLLASQKVQSLKLAEELFAFSNALQGSSQLRGLLSDPSAESSTKEQIIDRVFAKLSSEALSLVKAMASLRWSSARDLADAAERLGVRAVAMQSSSTSIEQLQAEIFQVGQLISSDSELELTLSSTRFTVEQKQSLIEKLLTGKVAQAALLLSVQAAASKSDKRISAVLDSYSSWIAQFAGESVAKIRVAKPISQEQTGRLSDALSKAYGKKLQINIEVDPEILGGVHVAVDGEVIDATMITKLTQARLQLS